jgi:glycosyltransferase involved in cell wall biosynthesis
MEELMNTTKELDLNDSVVFAGWKRDMVSIYQTFDAVVLTSKNEGTPVTLIEAMAAGIPVASTDVGGVKDLFGKIEIVTGEGYCIAENGILVQPNDPEAMAKAIMFLIEENEKCQKKAENARVHVHKKYSFERLSNDIRSLYDGIVRD